MAQFCPADLLLEIVKKQKQGQTAGIYSICSAHRSVLRAAMREAAQTGETILIEATCNQVNQFGGYTGMTPQDFAAYVRSIAQELDFPVDRIILGGDHLGINPWQKEPIAAALAKAVTMVGDFVRAGFTKIHLDMSMPAADDLVLPLSGEIIAERSAILCEAAEKAAAELGAVKPVYIIGSEVPPPGGAKSGEAELAVTSAEDALATIELFRKVFSDHGLDEAFKRTVALVVQPGVEFGDHEIHDYDREKAIRLSEAIRSVPNMVYEAHSTDYQTADALKALVADHFAILKVGPELTFAYREALFALALMEEAWVGERLGEKTSRVLDVVDDTMKAFPENWLKFYGDDPAEQAFSRKYSLSDRVRYYWNQPDIQRAVDSLLRNIAENPLPYPLLSQFLPEEARLIREGKLANTPEDLLEAHIGAVIRRYRQSCGANS